VKKTPEVYGGFRFQLVVRSPGNRFHKKTQLWFIISLKKEQTNMKNDEEQIRFQ
jgi:hypothetical protein